MYLIFQVMLAMGNGAVVAAFADFLVAIIFLVTALIAFIILTRTEFYRYYANESALASNSDQVESGNKDLNKPEFFKLKDHGIYIFDKLICCGPRCIKSSSHINNHS